MKRLFITLSFCLISILGMMAQKLTTQEFQQLKQMANEGNVEAEYVVGMCYYSGEGVTQSYTEAVKWYHMAAVHGNVNAQYDLACCYHTGEGVSQSHTEAVRWFRKAAEQGDVKAQYNLACCYSEGEGVPQSHAEAARWFREAAIQGLAEAQYSLGRRYQVGEGVTKSLTEAVKWWLKAAEQGLPDAQYDLGLCYAFGYGVTPSDSEAAKWFRKAAEQGFADAQEKLDIINKRHNWQPSSSASASTAKSQDQTKSSSSTQAQRSVKRNNSGIITLKNHVFGFVSTPPSQCTISTVINEVQSKYGFKPSVTSGTLLTWNEITKPVGFDFVLNGKRLGSASFYQGNNYRSWEYKILELKTSTTFNASVNYVKQLQSELEAEGYVFEIKSSGNENYNVESRNKDVIIELDCCSASKFAAHDVWKVNINFRTK